MNHDIDIGMKKHLKIQENVFLVTIGTPGHFRPVPATIYIGQHKRILQKYQKNRFFRFFQYCPEVAGNVIYGRKLAFGAPESAWKR